MNLEQIDIHLWEQDQKYRKQGGSLLNVKYHTTWLRQMESETEHYNSKTRDKKVKATLTEPQIHTEKGS